MDKDITKGGNLIRQVMHNIINGVGDNLPIYLTPKGKQAARVLSTMLNNLESSAVPRDNALFSYLSKTVNSKYEFNFDSSSSQIKPNVSYSLPLNSDRG